MKKFYTFLILAFCAFQTTAQTQNAFIDTRCKEIADAKTRAKLELERLEREEKSLQGQKVELRLKQFNDELIALEIAENVEMNRVKERFLKLKGEVRAKMETAVLITPQICN